MQEFVGWLRAGEGYDNPVVTQVVPTVASKPATTARPAAQAPGLDGMPAPAERATLDPEWHGNGTGGDWPQLGCTVLRMEGQGQGREILETLRVPPWALPLHRLGTGIIVLTPRCGDSPAPLSSLANSHESLTHSTRNLLTPHAGSDIGAKAKWKPAR